MNYGFKKSQKLIAGIIFVAIFFTSLSPVFAIKAEAQWVVWDPGNFVPNAITAANTTAAGPVKEFGLDSVAWIIVNLIIERMAASTVNWINSGFNGSPAFVTDPAGYFQNIGDQVAGQFIFNNPQLKALCGPIQAKVRLALTSNYVRNNVVWQCTLTDVVGNIDDFMGDFEQGGWDGFFELTQKQQNNPIGAYLQAENELNIQIASRQGVAQKELDWGNGFLSFKKCETIQTGGAQVPGLGTIGAGSTETCTTQTPGSVISEQLNKTLEIGGEKLAAADEINEIVSALLNQLVGKIVGGIGKGLRSLSKPDSGSGNQTFTNEVLKRGPGSQVTGYFCLDDPQDPGYDPTVCKKWDSPDTDVLKIPPPDLSSGIPTERYPFPTGTTRTCDPNEEVTCP